ncbi:MAG TPA: hypothetical protein VMV69_25005 [Pirellulales bacterium]|nr:hypothetical protein [Pirellulales bacterium]
MIKGRRGQRFLGARDADLLARLLFGLDDEACSKHLKNPLQRAQRQIGTRGEHAAELSGINPRRLAKLMPRSKAAVD